MLVHCASAIASAFSSLAGVLGFFCRPLSFATPEASSPICAPVSPFLHANVLGAHSAALPHQLPWRDHPLPACACVHSRPARTWLCRPLPCPCVAIAALSPISVLRLDVWQVIMHLRGRSAGAVWGDLTLRRFNDWRASAGARFGALPSCGAHFRQSATPRARIDGKNRCTRRPTRSPRGGIWEQNCGLWQLAITD
jgi:hypothetical protein